MPQETLTFPPLYCIVGAYRLVRDPSLWQPMWQKCSKATKQAGAISFGWAILTWPIQKLFVYYFLSASALVTGKSGIYHTLVAAADRADDDLPFRIPVPSFTTFTTFLFILGQVHSIMEFWLRRKLSECRNTAYMQTVRSRGKPADWWTEYVEEFENPPKEKAIKNARKQGFYLKLASPVVRVLVTKVFLLPMHFVPFFGMVLGAALRSPSFGRILHKPFFEAKGMSSAQVDLWVTERQKEYRSFGFVAALLERIPLLGLVLSVSNRIGAAMWAHDLEKRQQAIRAAGSGAKIPYEEKPTIKQIMDQATSSTPASSRIMHFTGEGLAVLRSHVGHDGSRTAMFTHLSFTFPLKLISPGASSRIASRSVAQATSRRNELAESLERPTETKAVAVLYVVGYGGGLVSGDTVDLDLDVGEHSSLVLLTQGSTKVFKVRRNSHADDPSSQSAEAQSEPDPLANQISTRQSYRFLVRRHSTLVVLPDPVTCYAASRYDQIQRFDIRDRKTCSLVLLDWITPGRTAVHRHGDAQAASGRFGLGPRRPEVWSFEYYRSRNEVRIEGQVVARDILLLEQDPELDVRMSSNTDRQDETRQEAAPDENLEVLETELARRNSPYGCYATLMLCGPEARSTIERLADEFETIQQRVSTQSVQDLIWSLSFLEREQQGPSKRGSSSSSSSPAAQEAGLVLVRIAGKDTETVRDWLRARLDKLVDVVGSDLYRQVLGG